MAFDVTVYQGLWIHRVWYTSGSQRCRCIYEPVQLGWPVPACRKGELFSILHKLLPYRHKWSVKTRAV